MQQDLRNNSGAKKQRKRRGCTKSRKKGGVGSETSVLATVSAGNECVEDENWGQSEVAGLVMIDRQDSRNGARTSREEFLGMRNTKAWLCCANDSTDGG
jgi:hypothetical protein